MFGDEAREDGDVDECRGPLDEKVGVVGEGASEEVDERDSCMG